LSADFLRGGTDNPDVFHCNIGGSSEAISDYVVPGFRRRSKAGEVFNNPMSYAKTEDISTGNGLGHYRNQSGTIEYYLKGPLTQQRSLGRDVYKVVRPSKPVQPEGNSALRAAAGIDTSEYSLGEDLFEIRETAKYLRNPLQSMKNLTDEILRKNGRGRDVAKAIADSYLSYRFAFSPLVRSVHDILEAYDTQPKRPPVRRTSHAREYASYYRREPAEYSSGTEYYKFDAVWREEVSVHTSILYEVSNPVYDWKWRYGLRTKDLPRNLWNVVPYSFMVDRIYDVGSFLQGAMNLMDPYVRVLAANTTTRRTKEYHYTLEAESNSGYSIDVLGNLVGGREYTQTREPYASFGVQDILPSLTPRMLVKDLTSIADLASLLIQRFTGGKR